MTSHLDGAVTIESVGTSSADGLFRASDARGEVAWPAVGERSDYLHVIEFAEAGVRRGFHAHPGHRERLYVFRGALRVLVHAAEGGDTVELRVAAGELIRMEPGVAHGFVALEPTLAVAMGTGSNPLEDTVPTPELGARDPRAPLPARP
jgi:dTDP-4-dehydrorhamnose 3,5-epimerase-like enzyme